MVTLGRMLDDSFLLRLPSVRLGVSEWYTLNSGVCCLRSTGMLGLRILAVMRVAKVGDFISKDIYTRSNTYGDQDETRELNYWPVERNGIRTKTQDKLNDEVLQQWVQSLDVAVFTETHLTKGENLHVPGYRTFQAHREKTPNASRGSGGVAVLIKRCISKGITRINTQSSEMIWLMLNAAFFGLPCDTALGAVYEGPQQSAVTIRENRDAFAAVQEQIDGLLEGTPVILVGDMNACTRMQSERIETMQSARHPGEVWGVYPEVPVQHQRVNQDIGTNGHGTHFINLCRKNELVIMNGRISGDRRGMFTSYQKRGHSVVDYAVVAASLLPRVRQFQVGCLVGDISDHAPIMLTVKVCVRSSHFRSVPLEKGTSPLHRTIWEESSAVRFRAELQTHASVAELADIRTSVANNPSRADIEGAASRITNLLIKTTECTARIITVRPLSKKNKKKGKLWFDKTCHAARSHVRSLGRQVQGGKEHLRHEFYRHRKAYKRLLKWKLRLFKRKMLTKMASMDASNQNDQYWKTLRELKNEQRRITGTDITMEQWVKHFDTLLNRNEEGDLRASAASEQLQRELLETTPVYEPIDQVITEKEVQLQIAKNKRNKSTFLDNVSNEMLHYAGGLVTPALTRVFNAVLSTGFYPGAWKGATLTPLHKKGDWEVLGNYRGIAVSCCLGKTLSGILNTRLTDFMHRSGLAHRYQTGFEKGCRTTDNTLTITTIIDQAKLNKKQVFMCFVDLQKAYDTVDRPLLFLKLKRAGIGSKFLALLIDMYTGVEYAVKYMGVASAMFRSNRGLKQGDGLSPKLFNCFMADVMSTLLEIVEVPSLGGVPIPALFFADDLVLMANTPEALQQLINKFQAYCLTNKLSINVSKTKTMVVGKQSRRAVRRNHMHADRFMVGTEMLEAVKSFSYLGVDFHASGAVPVSNSSMTLKAERAQAVLLAMTGEASVPLSLKLYRQLVEPIALYATEVWAPYALTRARRDADSILQKATVTRINPEALFTKFIKRVLGTKRRSINAAVNGEVGARSMIAGAMERTATYLRAIDRAPRESLVSIALSVQRTMHQAGKQCWYRGVARLQKEFGDTEVMKKGRLTSMVVEKQVTQWKQTLQEGSRLKFLTSVKTEYTMERYLQYGVRKVRRAVAKFRVSDHNLRVERDRWLARAAYVPREQRICTHCDAGQVQDEPHVFTCTWHRPLQRRYNIDPSDPRGAINDLVLAKPNVLWYVYHTMKAEDDFCKAQE